MDGERKQGQGREQVQEGREWGQEASGDCGEGVYSVGKGEHPPLDCGSNPQEPWRGERAWLPRPCLCPLPRRTSSPVPTWLG